MFTAACFTFALNTDLTVSQRLSNEPHWNSVLAATEDCDGAHDQTQKDSEEPKNQMKAQIIHLNKYLNVFNQAVNLKNKIRKMKSCRYRKTHGKYYNVKCWSHFTRLLKMNGNNTVFSLNTHIHYCLLCTVFL